VPAHIELRLDGFVLGLGTVEAAREVHGVEPAPGAAAGVVVVWADDVDGAFSDLVAAGVRPSRSRTTTETATAARSSATRTARSSRSSPTTPPPDVELACFCGVAHQRGNSADASGQV
jgi:hypothetical protein